MTRKFIAALACRSQGSRLYGKPVQNLDVATGVRILDNILDCLSGVDAIDTVVLGIAEGPENDIYVEIANAHGLQWIRGDETDVLSRLIACADAVNATDIFRVTSESPFPYFEAVDGAWARYLEAGADGLFLDDIVDGCGFEILSAEALRTSHQKGDERHRSELCTLYMRENHKDFKILRETAPAELVRHDLRLTVDNPEDLVLARAVYQAFSEQAPHIRVSQIVAFLDEHPELIALCSPFTETGYETMYVWGKTDEH